VIENGRIPVYLTWRLSFASLFEGTRAFTMLGSTLAIAIGLLSIHGILARPIKGIDRAVIQDEYDFIIAGGDSFDK
jgi:hypothetical protein